MVIYKIDILSGHRSEISFVMSKKLIIRRLGRALYYFLKNVMGAGKLVISGISAENFQRTFLERFLTMRPRFLVCT